VQYATDHGALEVVLVAESMGGGIVGQFLLQSSLADMVAAIVLDAPALDFTAIASAQIASMHLPLASLLGNGAVWLSSKMLPIDMGQANTTQVFADFAGPLFLSHGARDRIVPVAESDRLAALRPGNIEYFRTEADHIQSWQENPERYDDALRAFLLGLQ
jgi:pimeloyl-ACP methyl ester carboxylesterase